jgi:DNA-binding XRE family transcriptional regulator
MILTGFQLRSARKALNLTLDKLSKSCEVSKTTLMRLEKNTVNLDYIKCYPSDIEKIYDFFIKQNLTFSNKNIISLNSTIENKPLYNNLTRFQFIVSRTAINLSHRELEKFINLSYGALRKFETKDNLYYLQSYKLPISDIINVFHKFGISYPNNLSVELTENTYTQQ